VEGAAKDLLAKLASGRQHFNSLRELVWYMCDYAVKSPVFKLPVEKVSDLLKSSSTFTVACSYRGRLISTTISVHFLLLMIMVLQMEGNHFSQITISVNLLFH
jgi:hypothetical protein